MTAPLVPVPGVPVPTVLHIVTPTVPAPVLVDGSPAMTPVYSSTATYPDADLYPLGA